jgi:lipopolysaccharide export system permease protein
MKIRILDRYILRTHIGPYFFGLAVIAFVFIMEFIFNQLGRLLEKGVSFVVVLQFFALSLGHMFALIIPMAVMPATLMAFGQLTADNEITAMKSSGISLYRMILPILVASAFLGVGLIFYNNLLLPETNHRLANLMVDIARMKPTIQIRENTFNDAIEGYTIFVKEKNDKTGEIKGVQIFEKKAGIPTTIIAAKGRMTYNTREGVLRFELEDGEIHEMPDPNDVRTYRRTVFKHFTLNIQDTARQLRRENRSYRGEREMSTGAMRAKIAEIAAQNAFLEKHMNQIARQNTAAVLSPIMPDLAPGGPAEALPPLTGPPRPGAPVPVQHPIPYVGRESEQIQQILENDLANLDSNTRQIKRYDVEIHKKYSIPVACIVFVLLGAPLAIRSGKKGMTMAIAFSIVLFLVYYVFLIGGEKLADRELMSPWLSMWLANIVLGVLSIFLLRRTAREFTAINWSRFFPLRRWNRANP